MKKSLLVSLLCLIGIGSMQTMKAEAQTPEFYAVFESDGVTMTLYYDEYRTSRGGVTEWWNKSIKNDITTVELSVNMKNGCPISTANWFNSFKKLTTINNLAYLNTSKVADMSYMFSGCSALKSLNLQSFYTRNVTNMSHMFANCTALTNLNVYSFDTRNVTDMSYMFSTCAALEELDLSGFTTPRVTNMHCMFYQCYALKTLDLSLFNPISVTDMTSMFASCSALTTIYCGANFSINSPASNGMFTLCNKLVGGNGTKYDSNYKDATYAHPDEEGNPGYFTAVEVENVLYAQLNANEKIMTIYCGNVLESETGITNWWIKYNSVTEKYHVTTIVLDQSVAKARPTSTEGWFYAFGDVTSFQGLEYLNTEDVKDMSNMFTTCISLTSLDVSSFNTANVEDMSYMFSGCLELKSLNISEFNTAKVKNMCGMFSTCLKLESVDVSGFDTENVTDMSNMFFTCSSLGSVNVSSFNVDKVTDMSYMFYGCSSLTEIICNRGWNSSSIYADFMFGMSINLKGGNGFAYALLNPTDNTYAWPDGMDGKPGYFTMTGEGFENIATPTDKARKVIYNGKVYILRNGNTYTLTGTEIK